MCASGDQCAGSLVCDSGNKCACASTQYHDGHNVCENSEFIQVNFMLNVCNSAFDVRDKI